MWLHAQVRGSDKTDGKIQYPQACDILSVSLWH
jgi:hypothetical protein